MKTIKVKFNSNGQTIAKTAIINDCLDKLSSSQKNHASDICHETWSDGYWSLFFDGAGGVQFEVEFKFDTENMEATLHPIKAITWVDDCISDVQNVEVTIL